VLLGKAAVRAFVEPIFRTTKYTAMSVTPDMTVPISNEMLYQNGSYMQTSTSGGKSAAEHGRFAVALLKGADGQWRLGYIMAFSDSVVPAKP
jgi:ketosteroid isomerase-like protein